jgi:putative salt-induced outer membrane protein YdiY
MRYSFTNTCFILCLFTALLLTISSPAHSAVVVLKNGDRITGRIVKMENKRLEIDLPSTGIIKMKWEDIQSLTTERPMSVMLYGEVDLPGDTGDSNLHRLTLTSLGEDGAIRLEDVRAINFAENDYRGYLSLGGNRSSGNSDTQALNISGNLMYRIAEHRFLLDGKLNRAEAGGENTANNAAINIKYDYFVARRFYVGGFNLAETDQFQNLLLRNTTGLVAGYDLLDREHHNLSVGAGPAAVYQDFTTDPATVTPSMTWLLRYEFMFRGDDVILFHRQQGFKDLGNGSATRVNADQGLRVKLIGNWRVNFEYDLRYNSVPDAGRKTTDTTMILGFSYDFKP